MGSLFIGHGEAEVGFLARVSGSGSPNCCGIWPGRARRAATPGSRPCALAVRPGCACCRADASSGQGCRPDKLDQLHIEIGVGAGTGDLQPGRDGAGDGHVFLQRIGLVNQHVGPVAGEALIVHHVALGHGIGGALP